MTVVLDTSVLVALVHSREPRHDATRRFMGKVFRGELGQPVSSEYVLDEGLTLLRRRPGRPVVSRDFASYFFGDDEGPPPLRLVTSTQEDVHAAAELHFDRYDQELSFTDCVLATLAARLDAPVASFDRGFDGVVARVEPGRGGDL